MVQEHRQLAKVVNRPLLHTRPLMAIANLASSFPCEVEIDLGGTIVNCKSIYMMVTKLIVYAGQTVEVVTRGPLSDEAAVTMKEFIESGCGHSIAGEEQLC